MVPHHANLHPGLPVNIILKADQRSGKLTPGLIQDILTKGDHPQGVKVRLVDGRVGRVQSLGEGCSSTSSGSSAVIFGGEKGVGGSRGLDGGSGDGGGIGRKAGSNGEGGEDQRADNGTSLMDYVKPDTKSHPPLKQEETIGAQEELEKRFPSLDPALVAAILSDYTTVEAAGEVLGALDGN